VNDFISQDDIEANVRIALGAEHYVRNLGENISATEARDFADWFHQHWPNRDMATAWQAWLSALQTIRD
jgi:hypothetical protein